ncbi:MAG: Rieske 2Fe-2S domain-containing protein [bacterium]
MSNWVEVGSIHDFNQTNKKLYRLSDDTEILVIKIKDSFFAVENRCSHDDKPLSDGKIEDSTIECKYHGAKFDIQTGKALKMPAVAPINIFKTKLQEGKIFVLIE